MAAEFVFFGDHLEGAGGGDGTDLQRAADLATTMVAQLGMGDGLNYLTAASFEDLERLRRTSPIINRRVEALLVAQLERAKAIVIEHSPFICELAGVLNAEGVVESKRARALFGSREKRDVP
jgi:cell division protease FtsH